MTDIPFVTCPFCGWRSYHPKDVKDLWCERCEKSHLTAKDDKGIMEVQVRTTTHKSADD